MDEIKLKERELENFWNKVDKKNDDECWLWKGAHTGRKDRLINYGTFYVNRKDKNKTYKAHRYMWEITHNEAIPKGMYICHSCDNPQCVNPNHLFLGTPKDNARDRDLKGRHGGAVLTWDQARAIRKECNLLEIMKKYNVSSRTITHILENKNWIEDP